jgi:hypothetical protein
MDHPPEDTTHRDEPPTDLGTLIGLLAGSPWYVGLADPERRRSRLYEALARSDDPMWREIGEQLRDGQMQLRHVLQVDAYWQHLQGGIAGREDELANTVAALEAEAGERRTGRAPS